MLLSKIQCVKNYEFNYSLNFTPISFLTNIRYVVIFFVLSFWMVKALATLKETNNFYKMQLKYSYHGI